MRKLGIAAKIYLAFGSIFLLAVVAASIGWRGFERVTESQNLVIDQAIPGLRQAHRLSALNASIGGYAVQLLRAGSEPERAEISMALFSEVDQVHRLIDDFEASDFALDSLQALRRTIADIENKLHRQDELVRGRIRQQARFAELEASLVATTEELNDLADSLVANAAATTTAITSNLYDLVEDNASQQQLYGVFDRLVEVDLDAMERMYELRLRSANLNGMFNRVGKESEIEALDRLRRRTAETLSILKRRVSEINDPLRRAKASGLLTAMEVNNGPLYVYGIFDTRVSLLLIDESLTELSLETAAASQALNRIVDGLNATGGTLINRVSTTAKASLDSSRRLFGGTSIVMLLVAAAILWWFIKRNVVRRLSLLQSATRSITRGDYEVNIPVEGHDELTDMGHALVGFRDNAIRNRKLDEELRQYRAHLEELVEERSEQLRKANQRLSEEVENHAVARARAEQASEAKTAFLATMSHELRTPLSGALGTLRLLSDTELEPQQRELVQIIDTANTSLLDIVNDILGYSQLEAGKLNIEARRFDLRELVDNVIGLMTVAAREKGNDLQLRLDAPEHSWLRGDSGKLHQILINLVGNANKFTDQGSITLQVVCAPSDCGDRMSVEFTVIDTGIGIAADKQEEVFQAFTQVDASSARRYGGIGLGLAICSRLVHALGGDIDLHSEPGRGTRIRFAVEMEICAAIAASPRAPVLPAKPGAGVDVLMVEDDATNSLVTRRYLQQLGHRVVVAASGEEALPLLDSDDFAMVLLDISLPGIDGLTILRHVREHPNPAVASMPVIAMSAHVFNEEVDEYLAAGMDGFLGKPFTLEALDQAIRGALDGDAAVIAARRPEGVQQDGASFNPAIVDDDIGRLGLASVEQFAEIFYRSAADLKAQLDVAIRERQDEQVEKLAHKLKGAAANFGLERLCALLAFIERQAAGAVCGEADQREALDVEYRLAMAELTGYLEQLRQAARKLTAAQ